MTRAPWLALLLALASPALAGELTPTLDLAAGGAQAYDSGPANKRGDNGEVLRARARLGLNYRSDGGVRYETALEGALLRADDPASLLPGDHPLRLENTTNGDRVEKKLGYTANLDRLNVQIANHTTRATLGRQALGHGSGKFFNPSDLFSPVNPSVAWTEYKTGVDAARLTRSCGDLAEAELYLVAHREGAKKAYYLTRYRTALSGADLSAYGGWTLGAPTLAFDLTGDVGGATLNLEAVARFDEDPSKNGRASLGASGRIGDTLDLFAEYHVNGPGELDWRNYVRATGTREWRNGEIFLSAVHYAAVGANLTVNPLLTMGVSWLVNLDDRSSLVNPWAEYWAAENLTLTAGATAGAGRGRSSEFGPRPDLLYLEVKYYR